MSKKPQKKFFDLARTARKIQTKSLKFVQHKILASSKALLLVGGDSNPTFKHRLISQFSKTWQIANIGQTYTQCDLHIPFNSFTTESVAEIQQKVVDFHKQYECIILMPEHHTYYKKKIADEQFISDIYSETPNKLQHALLSYRLAANYLTSTGVVMLSGSQRSFFAEKGVPIGEEVNSGQIFGLNILLGERDHVDSDSHGFVALIEDLDLNQQPEQNKQTDADRVLEMLRMWSEGRGLPFPGSYAKMIRKDNVLYPEFY